MTLPDVCPVRAICYEDDVPDVYKSYIALNAARWKDGEPITERLPPLSTPSLEEVKAREIELGYGVIEDP